MTNHIARSATAVLMAAGFLLSTPLSATPPKAAPEPNAIAQRVWAALLTRCGDSYFYAGNASLDAGGMLANAQVGKNPVLEFKGIQFHLVPIAVSDAERANGIQYRGRMTMIAHLYRNQGESWQDGADMRRRDMSDIVGRVLADADGEFFGMGGGGSMAIQLVKYQGRWAFARSSTDFTSTFGAQGDFQLVDKFVKAPAARYNCATGKVILPAVASSAASDAGDDQ